VCGVVGSLVVLVGMAFVTWRYLPKKGFQNHEVQMVVIEKHSPKLVDEIDLNLGDIVIVEEKFNDGWAFGKNITTDCKGSFPLKCLSQKKISENENEIMESSRYSCNTINSLGTIELENGILLSPRISSLYKSGLEYEY